jgi:hypothetical protein
MPFPHASLNHGYIYPMMPIAKQFLPFIVEEGSGCDIEVRLSTYGLLHSIGSILVIVTMLHMALRLTEKICLCDGVIKLM